MDQLIPSMWASELSRSSFAARWVGRCGLRKVREVLATRPRPEIIIGTEISRGAREEALNAGLGWVDETGGAELHFVRDGALIDVSRPGSTARVLDLLRSGRWRSWAPPRHSSLTLIRQ